MLFLRPLLVEGVCGALSAAWKTCTAGTGGIARGPGVRQERAAAARAPAGARGPAAPALGRGSRQKMAGRPAPRAEPARSAPPALPPAGRGGAAPPLPRAAEPRPRLRAALLPPPLPPPGKRGSLRSPARGSAPRFPGLSRVLGPRHSNVLRGAGLGAARHWPRRHSPMGVRAAHWPGAAVHQPAADCVRFG